MLAFIDTSISGIVLLFWVAVIAVTIWFLWRALARAGLPGALALVSIVPLGFFVVLGILAFAEWPALRKPQQQEATERSR